MVTARLEIVDDLGHRTVRFEKPLVFAIGHDDRSDLRVVQDEVSAHHAEIVIDGDHYVLRDLDSQHGTFVNDVAVHERVLAHGDRIRLGCSRNAEMVFLVDELRYITSRFEALRSLGPARVVDEVLALVVDLAIETVGAERGFIMLVSADHELEFKLARGRGRVMLPGDRFETSRKIPEEVFATGADCFISDLHDAELQRDHEGTVAAGIRHVLCVPLRLVRYVDRADLLPEPKQIGVLYLDGREKGRLSSEATRAALHTVATEAALAIENARLYGEKLRIDQELQLASEMQQALLPRRTYQGSAFEVSGVMRPCRAIGGDFFDYLKLPDGALGVALGDVAGKGPPAALLTAILQGIFSSHTAFGRGPAQTVARINRTLMRHAIEYRFATMFYGVLSPAGQLKFCNAAHNPPVLLSRRDVRRLEQGGLMVGIFEEATFEEGTVTLEPGDVLAMFSDGVSEAMSATGEEFGEDRVVECVQAHRHLEPSQLVQRLLGAIDEFSVGTSQRDDITVLVVRFRG